MVVRTSRGITPRITSAVNMLSTFTNSPRFSRVRFSMYRRSASASFKRHIPSIVSESEHSWDIVPSPYPSCRVTTSPQTGVRGSYHVGQGPKAISAHIGSELPVADFDTLRDVGVLLGVFARLELHDDLVVPRDQLVLPRRNRRELIRAVTAATANIGLPP